MTASDKYLAMPSDFLAPFSLAFTDSNSETVFVDYKDPEFIQSYNPNPATTGVPKYYGSYDVDNFILGPTPVSSFSSELHYFYRPQSLTALADSGTTWLSENAPNAMLFGSLVEANLYMKGDSDLMQMYEGRYQESLARLKDYAEARENSDAYRRGLPERRRS
jgi:hypothetical protein